MGVVFLHGYAGSYALECWLVASAARALDALTICPAMGFSGRWWTDDGERTLRATLDSLRATLDWLRARGVRRVYLAGLSNGGVGPAWLARRFAGGARRGGAHLGSAAVGDHRRLACARGPRRAGLADAGRARAFAERNHATYVGFDAGHFALLVKRIEAREAIARWLREREHR